VSYTSNKTSEDEVQHSATRSLRFLSPVKLSPQQPTSTVTFQNAIPSSASSQAKQIAEQQASDHSTFSRSRKPVLQSKVFSQESASGLQSASDFFRVREDSPAKPEYFESYLHDQREIQEQLEAGLLWQGKVRLHPRNRQRAFVVVGDLQVDVLVDGERQINRALDGDLVLLELLPVALWADLESQWGPQAKISSVNQLTGEVTLGIEHLKPRQEHYTNETAVETRVVDQKPGDKLSRS
jgi:hypothetical protein